MRREPGSLAGRANVPSKNSPDKMAVGKRIHFPPGPVPEPQGLVAHQYDEFV